MKAIKGSSFFGRFSHGLVAHVTGVVFVFLLATRAVGAPHALTVIRDNCFSCHGAEKPKAGLVLSSREAMLRGGDSGPAVVPGNAGESPVLKYLAPDADPHMPPKKQLSVAEIATVREWIEKGAVWDEAALAVKAEEKPVVMKALPTNYKPVMAVAVSLDDKRLVMGRGNRVVMHDLSEKSRPVLWQHEVGPDVVCSVAFSPDGKHVVAGTYGQLVVRDAATGAAVGELKGLRHRVTAVRFLDEKRLALADGAPGQTGRVSFWTVGETSAESKDVTHGDSVLAIAGIESMLITAGADRQVKVWDGKTYDEKTRLEGHPGHVLSLAMKTDGTGLASGGVGGEVRVWDLKTGERKNIIAGHPAAVTALAFSPDGKTIYSACEDGAVRVCREDRGQPEKTFPPAGDMIYCLAMTSDGKTIFGGCHDGFVYVWDSGGKLETKLE